MDHKWTGNGLKMTKKEQKVEQKWTRCEQFLCKMVKIGPKTVKN